MFLQVITPRHIPGNGALSEVLSLKIYLAPGDVYLTGVTVPFELNGERIQLRTTRLKIVVESDPSAVTPQPEEPAEKPERPAVAPQPGEPAEKREPPVVTPKPPVVKPQPEEEIIIAFSPMKGGLKLELSLPRVTYQRGDELRATLSLINTTPEEISFSTRTSQVFDLIIPGQGLPRRMLWSEDRVFLPVITEHYIPADERLSDILSLKIDLTSGEFELIGVTVPFELNGELIRLKTTPLRITVE
ncbi:MAG: hypothetical protein DDT32_01990 [Syntrophomonadaceae bacterium]|nr:hypothetical protein [Bacillota bacterium]